MKLHSAAEQIIRKPSPFSILVASFKSTLEGTVFAKAHEPKLLYKAHFGETSVEVSTLELLVKPIAPRNSSDPAIRAIARRVVQGYFLTIPNSDEKDLQFRIEFLPNQPNLSNADRSLFDNTALLFNTVRGDNHLSLSVSNSSTVNQALTDIREATVGTLAAEI
jgi:hypothetical protein